VEHAPKGKRGYYGSWPQVGIPAGTILSNAVLILMTTTLTNEQFFEWGWRVPFLLSAVLVGIGLYIRLAVQESATFTRLKQAKAEVRVPLVEVLRRSPGKLILGTFAVISSSAIGWIGFAFLLSYGTQNLGLDRGPLLTAVLVAAAVGAVALLLGSAYSDKVGRRTVFVWGAIGQVVWAFPFFWLINTGNFGMILIALCVMQILTFPMLGVLGAMLSEAFPTKVRYTGASLAYHLGSMLGGAIAPLVGTAIVAGTGSTTGISIYILAMAVISGAAVMFLGETKDIRLDADEAKIEEERLIDPETADSTTR
jgi:MFS family permease